MKKILHLTLKRIYFDQIAIGVKKIEYRKVTPYWIKRLRNKEYDEVWFRNGYTKDRPFMKVKCRNILEGTEDFHIFLGKILEFKNYKWVV